MKILARTLTCCFWLCSLHAFCGETNASPKATSISPNSIMLMSKKGTWSLDELNKKALQHLRDTKGMDKAAKCETIAHILYDDSSALCEFLYFQGFERPF